MSSLISREQNKMREELKDFLEGIVDAREIKKRFGDEPFTLLTQDNVDTLGPSSVILIHAAMIGVAWGERVRSFIDLRVSETAMLPEVKRNGDYEPMQSDQAHRVPMFLPPGEFRGIIVDNDEGTIYVPGCESGTNIYATGDSSESSDPDSRDDGPTEPADKRPDGSGQDE